MRDDALRLNHQMFLRGRLSTSRVHETDSFNEDSDYRAAGGDRPIRSGGRKRSWKKKKNGRVDKTSRRNVARHDKLYLLETPSEAESYVISLFRMCELQGHY